ncbi:hypothetical protein ACKWTF_002442 [Chironomus riparius]
MKTGISGIFPTDFRETGTGTGFPFPGIPGNIPDFRTPTTDRSMRFRSERKEITIERVITEDNFYKNKALVHGDVICMKSDLDTNVCIIGKVMNFKYEHETAKKDKKFPFSYVILNINKKVSLRLSPCVSVTKRAKLMPCNLKYIPISSYILSVKENHIDLSGTSITQRFLSLLKEKIRTL